MNNLEQAAMLEEVGDSISEIESIFKEYDFNLSDFDESEIEVGSLRDKAEIVGALLKKAKQIIDA